MVPPRHRLGCMEVLRQVELHELTIDVQQERRVDFTPVHGRIRVRLGDEPRNGEDVDGTDPSSLGPKGAQRLLVRVRPVCGQDDELGHATVLPIAHEVVEETMQRLGSHGSAAGELGHRGRVHAIFYGGCAEHLELG